MMLAAQAHPFQSPRRRASISNKDSTTTMMFLVVLSACFMIRDCGAIRGQSVVTRQQARRAQTQRAAAEFDLEHNYLYNDNAYEEEDNATITSTATREEDNDTTMILHFNEFPFSQENIVDLNEQAADDDPRSTKNRSDDSSEYEEKSKKSKKSKSLKHLLKRPYKVKKKDKGTAMPTGSTAPSSMPSVSNQPTATTAPSQSPTMTSKPSVSMSPSQSPTGTPMPSMSPAPSSTPPTMVAAGGADGVTQGDTAQAPPTMVSPNVEVMNKFALGYQLQDTAGEPNDDDYSDLAKATGWYVDNHLTNFFEDEEETDFVHSEIVSYYEPSPLVVDYDALSFFAEETSSSYPTQDQLDFVIAYAFTTSSGDYVDFLSNNLPAENPFSKTSWVKYSTYWEALAAAQEEEPSSLTSSTQVEASDNTTTKIVAPILAIAGTIVVIAGIYVVIRERKKRQSASRVDSNRWDEKGANLNLPEGTEPSPTVEEEEEEEGEETLVLDAASGDHSCVPNTLDSRLSPVNEAESSDDGAVVMGELPEQAPSDVMREMNLTSALEDVDLDNETGGVGEISWEHSTDRIAELPEKHDDD